MIILKNAVFEHVEPGFRCYYGIVGSGGEP